MCILYAAARDSGIDAIMKKIMFFYHIKWGRILKYEYILFAIFREEISV